MYCPIPTQKSIRRIGKSRVKILGYSNHATQPVNWFSEKARSASQRSPAADRCQKRRHVTYQSSGKSERNRYRATRSKSRSDARIDDNRTKRGTDQIARRDCSDQALISFKFKSRPDACGIITVCSISHQSLSLAKAERRQEAVSDRKSSTSITDARVPRPSFHAFQTSAILHLSLIPSTLFSAKTTKAPTSGMTLPAKHRI